MIVAIRYARGPGWKAGTTLQQQDLAAHGAFMKEHYDAGTLMYGGPFLDDEGGMCVVTVPDLETAVAFTRIDPGVVNGTFVIGEIHPWYPVDWAAW